MMSLDWSEHAKLERGAALPVDESLLVMLRERRKGPERVEATEITFAEDPLFAIVGSKRKAMTARRGSPAG